MLVSSWSNVVINWSKLFLAASSYYCCYLLLQDGYKMVVNWCKLVTNKLPTASKVVKLEPEVFISWPKFFVTCFVVVVLFFFSDCF